MNLGSTIADEDIWHAFYLLVDDEAERTDRGCRAAVGDGKKCTYERGRYGLTAFQRVKIDELCIRVVCCSPSFCWWSRARQMHRRGFPYLDPHGEANLVARQVW